MPQEIDSQYDALVETYAEIQLDRMNHEHLQQYVYDDLVDYYENMTENELIEHIVEMEDSAEIVTSIYGNYPVDRDQEIEGRDYHQYSLKEGESLSFPLHKKWGSWNFLKTVDKLDFFTTVCNETPL